MSRRISRFGSWNKRNYELARRGYVTKSPHPISESCFLLLFLLQLILLMSHNVPSHSVSASSHHRDGFLVRLRKNLVLETKKLLHQLLIIGAFFASMLTGAIVFLFEFETTKKVAGFILPLLFIYISGKYLTLLPMYIVFVLLVIPIKAAGVILATSVFFSFFIIFLI